MSPHPSLPGEVVAAAGVGDRDHRWEVAESTTHYDTPYLRVTHETIVAPDGSRHGRAVVRPNGAVGVLAIDDADRVLLIEQYRHPVGRRMIELPAGTLDVEGEGPQEAAARELAEETDVHAGSWEPLLSMVTTPGYSSEAWEVFLATDLVPVPEDQRTRREAEEADMHQYWVPFDDVVDLVLAGSVRDAMTVAAVLAERVRRTR